MKYKAITIKQWDVMQKDVGKPWLPARPLPQFWDFENIKLAWFVLIGRYDALDWEDWE